MVASSSQVLKSGPHVAYLGFKSCGHDVFVLLVEMSFESKVVNSSSIVLITVLFFLLKKYFSFEVFVLFTHIYIYIYIYIKFKFKIN